MQVYSFPYNIELLWNSQISGTYTFVLGLHHESEFTTFPDQQLSPTYPIQEVQVPQNSWSSQDMVIKQVMDVVFEDYLQKVNIFMLKVPQV